MGGRVLRLETHSCPSEPFSIGAMLRFPLQESGGGALTQGPYAWYPCGPEEVRGGRQEGVARQRDCPPTAIIGLKSGRHDAFTR